MRYLNRMLQLRSFRVGVVVCVLSMLGHAGGARTAAGAVLPYTFAGKVSTVLSAPFGLPVSNGVSVVGDFSYDPALSGFQGSTPSVMKYDHPYALNMTFAPGTPNALAIAINGFRIEITNNSVQPGGTFDLVSLLYSSDVLPLSSIAVNGIPKTSGMIRINLLMPANTLAAPMLPPDLSAAIIPQPTNFFADTATGGVDVIHSITKLTLVPEPGSIVLIFWGATMAFAARKRIPFTRRRGC